MTARRQKRLAILAGLGFVTAVLAANAHLIGVAVLSQPACVAAPDRAPARPAC